MLTPKLRRWLLLGAALVATAAAALWPQADDNEVVTAVVPRRDPAVARQRTSPAPLELPKLGERLERARVTGAASSIPDLFGATNWNPPPPPPQPAKPGPTLAVTVAAPPFPYVLAGTADGANGLVVVFSRQNQDFAAGVGDVLERTYRVDAIAAQSVTVTYLPLGIAQVVPIPR